jgi:DNA transformation protein
MASSHAGSQFAAHVMDLLAPLGPVTALRFFGGIGLVQDRTLFAMIMDETLYFRVNAKSRQAYEAAGGQPFRYETKIGSRAIEGFFTVPEGLFDDPEELNDWARTAQAVAAAAKAEKRPRKPGG